MINNRQAGRRRGRNNNNPRQSGGGGNRGNGDSGNRIDNRARGNAAQLLEKYRNMARDAQLIGDRVNMEYNLQFADHYFRVLADNRARQEENQQGGQQGQQRFRRFDENDQDDDFGNDDDGFGDLPEVSRAPDEYRREEGRQGQGQARDGRDDNRQNRQPRDDNRPQRDDNRQGRQNGNGDDSRGSRDDQRGNRDQGREQGRDQNREPANREPFSRDDDRAPRDGNRDEARPPRENRRPVRERAPLVQPVQAEDTAPHSEGVIARSVPAAASPANDDAGQEQARPRATRGRKPRQVDVSETPDVGLDAAVLPPAIGRPAAVDEAEPAAAPVRRTRRPRTPPAQAAE